MADETMNPPMPPGGVAEGAEQTQAPQPQSGQLLDQSDSGPPLPPGGMAEGAPANGQDNQILPMLKEDQKPPEPQGFVNTVTSDIGKGFSGLADSAGKMANYLGSQLGIGQPSQTPDQEKALFDAQDAHKSEVYKQFREDFQNQKYGAALKGLTSLFDPKYDDPNDPIQQMAQAQWDSSKMARSRMLESMKSGDYKGVVQHMAGILPIASQVDDAMETYAKNQSRENLAHVVTAAVPAFIPSMFRGAKMIAKSSTVAKVAASLAQSTGLPATVADATEAASQKFGGASHVYDPVSGSLQKVEDVGKTVTPRQEIGEQVQQAAETVQSKAGQDVGAAKARAAAVPLPGSTSVNFMNDMIKIADEVDKHMVDSKALGPGPMGKVKALVDEISGKPLGQKEFEGYSKRIESEIDKANKPEGDAQSGRMYTKIKQALKNEYYNQIALSDPAVSKALQDANHAYAGISERLERGAAKRAFGADSPEMIAKQVQSGGITETKADAIMQTLKEADQLTPRTGGSYVNDFRRSVLYQQSMKYATKIRGVVTRIDSAKMLEELDKNPTFRHVYGDDYSKIYEAVKADARKQMFQSVGKKVATGAAITGAAYTAKNHIIHLFGSLIGGQ